MEWEANHMDAFITPPQNDLFYFLGSMIQGIHQERFGVGEKYGHIDDKRHCILEKGLVGSEAMK